MFTGGDVAGDDIADGPFLAGGLGRQECGNEKAKDQGAEHENIL